MNKQPEISIYSQVPLNRKLMDTRRDSFGIIFGKVTDVARQYGVKIEPMENCTKFSAPSLRIQLFIEKLHFSKTFYSSNIF